MAEDIYSDEFSKKIMFSAVDSLDWTRFKTREDMLSGVTKRALTLRKLFGEGSMPMQALEAISIYATIDKVEEEESTGRLLVHFTPVKGDGEQETIRTPHTNKPEGKILQGILAGAEGKKAIIYKILEKPIGAGAEKEAPKKGKAAPQGYRLMPWVEILG